MCTPGSDRGKGTRRGRGLAGDVRPPAHCCTAGTQRTGVVATSTDLRECPAGRRRLAVRVQPPAHGGAVLPERAGMEGTGADLAERTSRRICLAVRIRPPAHGGGVGPDSAIVVRPRSDRRERSARGAPAWRASTRAAARAGTARAAIFRPAVFPEVDRERGPRRGTDLEFPDSGARRERAK